MGRTHTYPCTRCGAEVDWAWHIGVGIECPDCDPVPDAQLNSDRVNPEKMQMEDTNK